MVEVEPRFRVLHVEAGPRAPVPLVELPELAAEFTEAAYGLLTADDYRVLHANYWVSGAIGHSLKHALDLPLVTTFHTLERVKAEVGIADGASPRPRVEAEVVRCADLVVASTEDERDQLIRHYGADAARIAVISPGVDHHVFAPGDRARARRDAGFPDGPVVLFVGRIQPLKGLDLAVRALAEMRHRDATLVVVGGPSGPDGADELARVHMLVESLGLAGRVRFFPPQPHERLTCFYRAADVCVVPSRTESFGLVALEAAACGTPVVAANVGGLRVLVDHGVTGHLVDGREPSGYAAALDDVLDDDPHRMGLRAVAHATQYRWTIAAARLRRSYDDLAVRTLVRCS